jgi:hypothetical protein
MKRRDIVALDRKNPPFAKSARDGAPVIFQHVVPFLEGVLEMPAAWKPAVSLP